VSSPQAGITNRPPDHALFAALELATADAAEARQAVEALRALVHAELRSDLAETTPQSDKSQPSAETGELGFADNYDRYHLTITVGFSKSGYDKLGVAAEQQPQDLIEIPWGDLGDSNVVNPANGDILLQICSDSVYITEHVLRRVEHQLGQAFRVVWTQPGAQRHTSRAGRTSRTEGRALIGFLDGTSNLNPRHSPEDAKLVFVDPAPTAIADYPPQAPPPGTSQYGQPQPPTFPPNLRMPPTRESDWTKGGSYAVVRASLVDTSTWDTRSLGDQEHIVGRWKVSGSSLDHPDNPDQPPVEPDFSADPTGATTPLTSHIRKANPRGPDDTKRRIFRRGYPLILPTADGTKRGLVFVAFGRTITTQFEFITRAWTTNPNFPSPGAGIDAFRQFETTILCGGYFFVPPLKRREQPWSWVIPPQA
jgi:deferrochelatase/peroxidase EfeB